MLGRHRHTSPMMRRLMTAGALGWGLLILGGVIGASTGSFGAVMLFPLLFLYPVPLLVSRLDPTCPPSYRRRVAQVNLRWGWTFVGWFWALGMALQPPNKLAEVDPTMPPPPVGQYKGPDDWHDAPPAADGRVRTRVSAFPIPAGWSVADAGTLQAMSAEPPAELEVIGAVRAPGRDGTIIVGVRPYAVIGADYRHQWEFAREVAALGSLMDQIREFELDRSRAFVASIKLPHADAVSTVVSAMHDRDLVLITLTAMQAAHATHWKALWEAFKGWRWLDA